MSRRTRTALLVVGLVCVGICLGLALVDMPSIGTAVHPYRDRAIAATIRHASANAISSVNFDQRAIDTFGEETILLGSVIGVAALLRPSREEVEAGPHLTGAALSATRLLGYVMLPVSIVLGLDVIAHGHLTPGGGFQGGVVAATGMHLLYVAGSYPALQRLRPTSPYEWGEALAVAGFAGVGIAGVAAGSAFLAEVLPPGKLGQYLSAGTVPLLSGATGVEVACGVMVLLAKFLDQAILLGPRR